MAAGCNFYYTKPGESVLMFRRLFCDREVVSVLTYADLKGQYAMLEGSAWTLSGLPLVVPDRTEPEPCQRAAVHAERLCSPMLDQIIQLVMQAASRIPTKAITASAESIVCLRSVSGLRQLGGRPAGQADPASRAAQRAVSTPRSIQVWSCL